MTADRRDVVLSVEAARLLRRRRRAVHERRRLAKLMREIRVHGQDRRYHHPRLGLTGRLDSIQAAVLLAKLEVFDDEVAARDRVGAALRAR